MVHGYFKAVVYITQYSSIVEYVVFEHQNTVSCQERCMPHNVFLQVERSCLMPNIKALYINLPVPLCDCIRKYTAIKPLLTYVSFYKNIDKKGRDQCIFANSFA